MFADSNPAEGGKIRSTASFNGKQSCLSHVVRFYGMLKNPSKYERGSIFVD
jgi:hypothetical protein